MWAFSHLIAILASSMASQRFATTLSEISLSDKVIIYDQGVLLLSQVVA